jgi:hypothetical protein
MIKLDVPVVLISPSLDGIPGLSSVDLVTFTGEAVNAKCL